MNTYKLNRVIIITVLFLLGMALIGVATVSAQTPIEVAANSDVVKTELATYMKSLRHAVETGAAFAGEQVPLILQEKILFARVEYTFWVISGLALFISALWYLGPRFNTLSIPTWKSRTCEHCWTAKIQAKETISEGLWLKTLILTILHCVGGFIGAIVFFANVGTLLQVWFAPRLYLVEWLISIVK